MRYVLVASATYGAGKVLSLASRMGWQNSGGDAISPAFARRMVEWVSGLGSGNNIQVCHVSIKGVDGGIPTIDNLDRVSVTRKDIEFLSEDNNLDDFDCVIISGYSSSSPLVRANLLSYVSAGNGIIVEDFRTSGEIDILNSISPFSVSSESFPDMIGETVWTDDGRGHPIYSGSFLSESIPLLNEISEGDLGSGWTVISVFDTEGEREDGVDTEIEFTSSDDVEIPGETFVAYYRSTYQNGIIDVDR